MMRTATFMALLLASAAALGQSARDFERRVPADPKGAVAISNVAGSITVTAWDRSEVDVKGKLGAGVERVDVTSERGRVNIKVVLPRDSKRTSSAADLHVSVPRGSELNVSAVSADITSRGLTGSQRLQTVSGDVNAEIGPANIEVKTVSGDTMLRGSGKPGELRVSSVSGDVELTGGAGRVEATTVSGDLEVTASPATSVRVRTTSGSLTFNGRLVPKATLDAETISGELTLRVSGEAGYEYEVSSFSGDIENCFRQSAESTSRFGPASRLSGTYGKGGATVRLKTLSGDVDLCDK